MARANLLDSCCAWVDGTHPSSDIYDDHKLEGMPIQVLEELCDSYWMPDCETKELAQRALLKWTDTFQKIGCITPDGGKNIVKRINGCKVKLELLKRGASKTWLSKASVQHVYNTPVHQYQHRN
jgi:hypothetical protein